ncbi:hypothetical protein ABTK80_19840, partial [Acinetobacter baumannii]
PCSVEFYLYVEEIPALAALGGDRMAESDASAPYDLRRAWMPTFVGMTESKDLSARPLRHRHPPEGGDPRQSQLLPHHRHHPQCPAMYWPMVWRSVAETGET